MHTRVFSYSCNSAVIYKSFFLHYTIYIVSAFYAMPSSCIQQTVASLVRCASSSNPPFLYSYAIYSNMLCDRTDRLRAYAVYNDDDDAAADKVGFQDKKLDLHLNALQFVLNFKCDFYLCILFMHILRRRRRDVCCI